MCELEEESYVLTGGVNDVESELLNEDALSNSKEPIGDTSSRSNSTISDMEYNSRYKVDASDIILVDPEEFYNTPMKSTKVQSSPQYS